MSISSTYYLNAVDLATATGIFTNPELTIFAPDGYYRQDTTVREVALGALLPAQSCPSCGYACSDYPIESNGLGQLGIFNMSISLGTGIGAVIIRVNPDYIPSGFLAEFNSISYNKFSSETYGYLAATSGATYLGRTSDDCGIVAGSPYLLYDYRYNGTDFSLTGSTDAVTVTAPQILTTLDRPNNCYMVIPKLSSSVATLLLSVYTMCTGGEFTAEISCPTLLQSFSATIRFANAFGPCDAIQDQTYYVAYVNGSIAALGLYDLVFTDAYGQNPLPDGFYGTTSSNGYIQVANGIIVLNHVC